MISEETGKPINLILAEDQEDLRQALLAYISYDKNMNCLAEFSDGLSAWNWIDQTRETIHVALLDIDMPGMNGIDLVRKIKNKRPEIQCLMCTIYEDSDRIFKALEAGASGYLLKKSSASQILHAIREIESGGSPMSSEIARRVVQSFNQNKPEPGIEIQSLSPREMEILLQLEKGFLYKEIAAKLNISVETVRRHVHNIYDKLHVGNRTEALNKLSGKS
jgi:DNA-binding NarL/FixJ family response regulator